MLLVPILLSLLPSLPGGPAPGQASQTPSAPRPPSEELLDHGYEVVHLALGPEGKRVYTTNGERLVRCSDLAKGSKVWEVETRLFALEDLVVGGELAVGSTQDSLCSCFSLEDGSSSGKLVGYAPPDKVSCVALGPEGKWMWMGLESGLMRLTAGDAHGGWSRRAVDHGGTTALAVSAGGKLLAIGGHKGTVHFAGHKSANVEDKKFIVAHESPVTAVCLDAQGKLVISGSEEGEATLWGVSNRKAKHSLEGHAAALRAAAFDPKATRCATADAEGVVLIWDVKKGACLGRIEQEREVRDVYFLGKGQELLVVGKSTSLERFDLSELE